MHICSPAQMASRGFITCSSTNHGSPILIDSTFQTSPLLSSMKQLAVSAEIDIFQLSGRPQHHSRHESRGTGQSVSLECHKYHQALPLSSWQPVSRSLYPKCDTKSIPCRQPAIHMAQSSNEGTSPAFTEEFQTRTSADEVRDEILACYKLVHKSGRGAVYFGSAQTKEDHPHYLQAMELGRDVALLLNCTSWTGAGPGMMDAVVQGALQANKPVGGFKISNEGGTWTNSCVLLPDTYLTCRFFSARKHGLVDAGVRIKPADRTAFIFLPGGVGTLDEIFEILTHVQLKRLGSTYPVPLLIMNYDGFYTNLLSFFRTCQEWGTVAAGEVEALAQVCKTNEEALKYLADFYGISAK